MTVPVVLYVPNLLGYARIIFAYVGLYYAETHPIQASWIWILSASLDLIDGILARRLNQTSSLGVLLDIAADNVLRTTLWIAAATTATSSSSSFPSGVPPPYYLYGMMACIVVSLEWITMVCTQLHAVQDGGAHWKTTREGDPWWIKACFANNFKSPLGVLCIGGLFGSGYMAYASRRKVLVEAIPFFDVLFYLSMVGRGMTMLAELWLCAGYLSLVVERDTKKVKKEH